MIYESVPINESIQQGDIFQSIPMIDFDPSKLPIVDDKEQIYQEDWLTTFQNNENPISAIVSMRAVQAIVISQNCDASRNSNIIMCEIVKFMKVVPDIVNVKGLDKTWGLIIKQSKINYKWFYLPPDNDFSFFERMAVDFQSTISISRNYLEGNLSKLRVGRLNDVSREHYRERLSDYFRRYAYDEWYAFDKQEFDAYNKKYDGKIQPYKWQI